MHGFMRYTVDWEWFSMAFLRLARMRRQNCDLDTINGEMDDAAAGALILIISCSHEYHVDFTVSAFWSAAAAVCFNTAFRRHWARYFLSNALFGKIKFQRNFGISVGGFSFVRAYIDYGVFREYRPTLGKHLLKQSPILALIAELAAVAVAGAGNRIFGAA